MTTTVIIIIGIFILFFIIRATKRKKQENSNEEVDISSFLFPNGKEDIEKGAIDVLEILNNDNVSELMAKSIYIKSTCICYLSNHNGEFTKESLEGHLSSYALEYFDDNSLIRFYEYLRSNDIHQKVIDRENFIKEFNLFSTLSVTDEGEITEGYGEFGFEKTNPVPVTSISDGYDYLEKLRTEDGREVTHERLGSEKVPNIEELIDSYDIYLDRKKIKTIYICPYGDKTSSKAPKGFKLEKKTTS